MRISSHGVPLFALFLLLAALGCERGGSPAPPAPAAKLERPSRETEVATVVLTAEAVKRLAIAEHLGTVEKRKVPAARTLPADVAARPGGASLVLAPFTGTVAAPRSGLVVPGAKVAKGDVLLELTPIFLPADQVQLTASLADAEGQVARARVELDAAAVSHRRTEQLVKEKALAARALEDSQAALDTARATLEAAVARRDVIAAAGKAAVERDKAPVTALASPIDGVLRDLRVAAGETVAAGAAVADVVSLSPLLVRVPVPSSELESIDRAAPARIDALLGRSPARSRSARPVTAPPVPSAAPGCVDLFFELANEGFVFVPGERVAAVLALRSDEESLVLPWGAVLQDALGGTWVYEATEDRATGGSTAVTRFVRRRVTVRRVDGDLAVLAGPAALVPGAKVVTEGAAELFGTEFGVGK